MTEAQPTSKKWYIVHTYSGYEGKVKLALEQRIKELGMEGHFGEILVPEHQVKAQKKAEGKSTAQMQKLFPGYVFVEMDLTNETWHLVKDTPKVTGFVGAKEGAKESKPKSVPRSQVENLRKKLSTGVPAEKIEVTLDKGQNVRIINGPFANFVGVVDESKPDRHKVRVLVSIFGRSTPIDLDFNQVETVK